MDGGIQFFKFLEEYAGKNLKIIALEDMLSWLDKNAK